jgi:iodotyrosine deiodinase
MKIVRTLSGSKSAAKNPANNQVEVRSKMMSPNQTEMKSKALNFYNKIKTRQSCRHFEDVEIDVEALKTCVLAAGSAPSGANKQPWFFSIVTDQVLKSKIRTLAEKEEFDFYNKKASAEFLKDLDPLKTTWQKPHLEEASALIVIFYKNFEQNSIEKTRCYYPKESVGISTGFLIAALHEIGLSTLTHTPNPMSFLNSVLNRPQNEKAFMILAVGQRSPQSETLNMKKKNLYEICEVL